MTTARSALLTDMPMSVQLINELADERRNCDHRCGYLDPTDLAWSSVVGGDVLVRNSRILGLLDAMLHSPLGSFRVVELVGRGITAEARCTQAVLEDKLTVSTEPVAVLLQRAAEAADLLIGFGTIEEDLADAWRQRCANDLDDPAFEAALDDAVCRLEAWPARWLTAKAA